MRKSADDTLFGRLRVDTVTYSSFSLNPDYSKFNRPSLENIMIPFMDSEMRFLTRLPDDVVAFFVTNNFR